jgi:RNA polymerase sigma-70 factor (ECF subfamily)
MDDDRASELLARAGSGDTAALSELFETHRPHLVRMVTLRLDPSLRSRLDSADIVQDAWLEVARRFPLRPAADPLPFRVWLRLVTAQTLSQTHRRHLAAHMRDALKEMPTPQTRDGITAIGAADAFVASATSPTQAVRREELRARVLAALDELDDIDREIVALRQLEGLSNKEAAAELAIEPAAASKRFMSALVRLRPMLQSLATSTPRDA